MKIVKMCGNEVGARTLAYLRGERDLFFSQCKSKQVLMIMHLPLFDGPQIARCPHCDHEFDVIRDECVNHFEVLRESEDWRKARFRHKACGGVVIMKSWAHD